MIDTADTEDLKSTVPTIGTALFAPDIMNSNSNEAVDRQRTKVEDEPVFILYSIFPNLEKLVDNFASRMTVTFPPAPPQLIPYRDNVDNFFEVKKRGTTFQVEVLSGFINFVASMYVLAVIPKQMELAGYDAHVSVSIVALIIGIATIASGLISNTPLVICPPVSIAIFFVVSLRQNGMSTHDGNMAVFYSGIMVLIVSFIGPIGIFLSKLIPETIQASTAMGVGLISALAGYVELGLIVQGQYSILTLGNITNEVAIATSGLILIAVLQFYHSKFSYLFGLVWGTFIWWSYQAEWPVHWGAVPTFRTTTATTIAGPTILLVIELFILHMIVAFGLARALIDLMGKPVQESASSSDKSRMLASIPKGRYIFIVIALANIMSGLMYGPPIVISPESSAGIRAGAKTGLSSVVCGLIFCVVAINFGPLYAAIPPAGTSPVLIMVGLLLFRNVIRVDFGGKYGMPAFVCLGLIPFTNSAIAGISFAYVTYVCIAIITGDIALEVRQILAFMNAYRNNRKNDSNNSNADSSLAFDQGALDNLNALNSAMEDVVNTNNTGISALGASQDSQDSLVEDGDGLGNFMRAEEGEGLVTPPRSCTFNTSSSFTAGDRFSPLASQSEGSNQPRRSPRSVSMSNHVSPRHGHGFHQRRETVRSTLQLVEDLSFEPDVISGINKQVVL